MIPGLQTRMSEEVVASAATINVQSDIVRVTGSTQINTINPMIGTGFNIFLVLIPVDGAVTLGTTGNISSGIAMTQNRAVFLVYDKITGKWYINSGV